MGDSIRTGAICMMLTVLFFPAQFVTQLFSPSYDIFLYDISLLGVSSCQVWSVATSGGNEPVCSPLHLLFNIGIIVHGLLSIAGIWLTRHLWPTGGLASTALFLIAVGGVGAMMVGAFPLDDMLIHVIGAVIAIAAPGAGFVLLAWVLRDLRPKLAFWTVLVGFVTLLSGLGHALGGLPFGRGSMERLAVWPQTIWFVCVGMMLYLRPRPLGRAVSCA
ncbi:DUF998 domain-containing protein [Devosia rhizoryzae]|uniref:DUF998 domain-containing protein n=1 Tax=Devosia rhizoryzae TaxID=2774137 RepID=A0ABX7C8P2_9HYPH|nr:DUF998 domain-containing protein [Devosia rhizoryzae]QQR40642.1 DUF998 domain-containing protein [Devosia rhizoryzae]